MKRRLLALAAAVGLLVGLQIAPPAAACACGAPAPRPGQDVIVDKEHAILSWDGEQERIELLLDMLTDADDVGLIFPTPAPATVTAGDRQTFLDIEDAIQPKQVVVDDWWAGDEGDGAAGRSAARPCSTRCSSDPSRRPRSRRPTRRPHRLARRERLRDPRRDRRRARRLRRARLVLRRPEADQRRAARGRARPDPVHVRLRRARSIRWRCRSSATTTQKARLYVFQDHRARIGGLDDPGADAARIRDRLGGGGPGWAERPGRVPHGRRPRLRLPGEPDPRRPRRRARPATTSRCSRSYTVTRPGDRVRHPVRGRRDPRAARRVDPRS